MVPGDRCDRRTRTARPFLLSAGSLGPELRPLPLPSRGDLPVLPGRSVHDRRCDAPTSWRWSIDSQRRSYATCGRNAREHREDAGIPTQAQSATIMVVAGNHHQGLARLSRWFRTTIALAVARWSCDLLATTRWFCAMIAQVCRDHHDGPPRSPGWPSAVHRRLRVTKVMVVRDLGDGIGRPSSWSRTTITMVVRDHCSSTDNDDDGRASQCRWSYRMSSIVA